METEKKRGWNRIEKGNERERGANKKRGEDDGRRKGKEGG